MSVDPTDPTALRLGHSSPSQLPMPHLLPCSDPQASSPAPGSPIPALTDRRRTPLRPSHLPPFLPHPITHTKHLAPDPFTMGLHMSEILSTPLTPLGKLLLVPQDPVGGAPGWRSRLSVRLQPGHDLAVREFEPRVGLWRSEERRVGKECASMCRSRWSPYH